MLRILTNACEALIVTLMFQAVKERAEECAAIQLNKREKGLSVSSQSELSEGKYLDN